MLRQYPLGQHGIFQIQGAIFFWSVFPLRGDSSEVFGEGRQLMKYVFQFLLSALGMLTTTNLSHALEAPPQQLLGKSIVVTWSENRVQRVVGEANFREVDASHSMSVYIGSSGRVFSRLTNTTGLGLDALTTFKNGRPVSRKLASELRLLAVDR
jgi:hypothetical protein